MAWLPRSREDADLRYSATMIRRLCVVACVLALGAGGVGAHAILDRTDPRAGGSVKVTPTQVRLWFTGALEPAYSRVHVLDAAGKRADLGDGGVDDGNRALLRVSVPPLAPGTYRVVWHVLSVDSHVTEGQFSFGVQR
jgi:methionine-rich copper-binding protein CopC